MENFRENTSPVGNAKDALTYAASNGFDFFMKGTHIPSSEIPRAIEFALDWGCEVLWDCEDPEIIIVADVS